MNMLANANVTLPNRPASDSRYRISDGVPEPQPKPLRVLLTHELFPPDYAGGGEQGVLQTARFLVKKGVSVRVLTTGDPSITSYEGIPTIRIPVHRYKYMFLIPHILELAREADLIQTFIYHACLPSYIAAKVRGVPIVCMVLGLFHDTWREMRGPFMGGARMAWEKFLITRNYDRVAFLSRQNQDLAVRLGLDSARAIIDEPGIIADLYRPAEKKQNHVLFVGKFEVRKGVYDVLDAARKLPDVPFRMIGWGPEDANLRRLAPRNVEILPFVNGPALRDQFALASIFFLPSRAEGFPYALLEAMASRCAVVSTLDLPFAGAQVGRGDTDAMASAICQLWSDRDKAELAGTLNLSKARECTWDRYADVLLDTYRVIMKQRSR